MKFFKRYKKAFVCTLVCANANYWIYELLEAINYMINNSSQDLELDRNTFTISILFPNTILFLPIFGGILIDYLGVLPVLRYLCATLLMGAVLLINAIYNTSLWTYMISALFFGFSVELINIATFVYLSNTYITKSHSIEYFRIAIGVYLSFGYSLSILPGYLSQNLALGFGACLIIISYLLSILLEGKKPVLQRDPVLSKRSSDNSDRSIESNTSIWSKKNILIESFIDEQTFFDKNDKDETNEMKGFSDFFRKFNCSNHLIIIALAIWVGCYTELDRLVILSQNYNLFIYNNFFLIQTLLLLFSGLLMILIKWNESRLRKAIFIGFLFDISCITILGLVNAEQTAFFVAQMVSTSLTFGPLLLSIPGWFEFQLDCLGKGYGYYRWISCIIEFLANSMVGNLEFSDQNTSYISIVLVPTSLSLILFVIAILVKVKEKPRQPQLTLSFEA